MCLCTARVLALFLRIFFGLKDLKDAPVTKAKYQKVKEESRTFLSISTPRVRESFKAVFSLSQNYNESLADVGNVGSFLDIPAGLRKQLESSNLSWKNKYPWCSAQHSSRTYLSLHALYE